MWVRYETLLLLLLLFLLLLLLEKRKKEAACRMVLQNTDGTYHDKKYAAPSEDARFLQASQL